MSFVYSATIVFRPKDDLRRAIKSIGIAEDSLITETMTISIELSKARTGKTPEQQSSYLKPLFLAYLATFCSTSEISDEQEFGKAIQMNDAFFDKYWTLEIIETDCHIDDIVAEIIEAGNESLLESVSSSPQIAQSIVRHRKLTQRKKRISVLEERKFSKDSTERIAFYWLINNELEWTTSDPSWRQIRNTFQEKLSRSQNQLKDITFGDTTELSTEAFCRTIAFLETLANDIETGDWTPEPYSKPENAISHVAQINALLRLLKADPRYSEGRPEG